MLTKISTIQTKYIVKDQRKYFASIQQKVFIKSPNSSKRNQIIENKDRLNMNSMTHKQDNKCNKCHMCSLYKQKLKKLQNLSKQVSQFKQQNLYFRQQIQLLTENFMYIIQLASENIATGAKIKLKKILQNKQKIIEKQAKVIKKLENQSEVLIEKVDAGLQTQEKLSELKEKIKVLEAENISLKASQRHLPLQNSNDQETNLIDAYQISTDSTSPKDLQRQDWHFSSLDLKQPETNQKKKANNGQQNVLNKNQRPAQFKNSYQLNKINFNKSKNMTM